MKVLVPALIFQSTLPMRGATLSVKLLSERQRFQSTLPMRGATENPEQDDNEDDISIHAPHAGSDHVHLQLVFRHPDFNPRSPCGERLTAIIAAAKTLPFQSTLPMRGATKEDMIESKPVIFQSTLPMRGATR